MEKTKHTLLKEMILPYTRLLIFKNVMPPKQENTNDKKHKNTEEDRTYYTMYIETYKVTSDSDSVKPSDKTRETIVFIWPKKSIMFIPENIEILPTRSVLFSSEPDTGMKVRLALFHIAYPKPIVDEVEKIIMKLFKRKENF